MDYPLNVMRPAKGNDAAGFAVASDAAEHAELTKHGYLPAHVAPEPKAEKKEKAPEPKA
jgi:hypothetical protein